MKIASRSSKSVELDKIGFIEYGAEDRIIVYAGVGNLPLKQVKSYCAELGARLEVAFDHDKVVILPVSGDTGIRITVFSKV